MNVCSNSVVCWVGRQTSGALNCKHRHNYVIHSPVRRQAHPYPVLNACTCQSYYPSKHKTFSQCWYYWASSSVHRVGRRCQAHLPPLKLIICLGQKLLWHTVCGSQCLVHRLRCWLDRETIFSRLLFTCSMCMAPVGWWRQITIGVYIM